MEFSHENKQKGAQNFVNTTDETKENRSEMYAYIGKSLIKLGIYGTILFILFTKILMIGTVPSSSMEETIEKNNQIIGLRIYKNLKRGDIVMFTSKETNSTMIKRIIGLPGEQITIRNNMLYINNKRYKEPYLKEKMNGMEEEHNYTVPKNCYFLLGDNRNNSYDARFWKNHYINQKNIIGKACFKCTTLGKTPIPYRIRRLR